MPRQTPQKGKFRSTPPRAISGVLRAVTAWAKHRLRHIAARLLRFGAHVLSAYAALRCSYSNHTAPQSVLRQFTANSGRGSSLRTSRGIYIRAGAYAKLATRNSQLGSNSEFRIPHSETRMSFGRKLAIGFLVLIAVSVAGVLHPTATNAATSDTVNFQAKLMTNTGGVAADGYYNVEFNLYTTASGGSSLWTEDWLNNVGGGQGVRVVNGYLTVNLGAHNAFPSNINWAQNMYIGMTVRGTGSCTFGSCTPTDSEMTPRLKLTAVPYAFSAGNLSNLSTGGFTSTLIFQGATVGNQQFTIPDLAAASSDTVCLLTIANCAGAGGGILGAGLQDYVAKFDNGSGNHIGNSSIYDNGSFVGINSTTNNGLVTIQGASTTQSSLFVQGTGSASVATAVIKQAGSQTGKLIEFQDSAGNVNGSISSLGNVLSLGRIASSGTVTKGQVILADGTTDNFGLTLQPGTLTANSVVTIPNSGGNDTVCLLTLANCVGTGGGITGSGTQNYLTKFNNIGGTTIGNSSLYDNGSFLGLNTTSNNGLLSIQGSGAAQSSLFVQAAASASAPTIAIKQATSQAGDLLQLVDTSGNPLGGFAANGSLYYTNSSFTTTLSTATLTANRLISLPNEGGTLCIQGSSNCGFELTSGNDFIQNQTATNQTAGFKINGNGTLAILTANTSVLTSLIDAPTAGGTIAIGTTNATGGIDLNQGVTVAANKSISFATGTGNFDMHLSTGTLQTGTGTISINGDTTVAAGKNVTVTSGATSLTGAAAGSSSAVTVNTGAASNVGLKIQGVTSQSADLLRNLDSNGAILSGTNANGGLYTNGVTNTFAALRTPAFTTASTGTSYYYVMTATNAAGETLASASLGMANNTSTLAWTQVAGATGYKIYRNTSNSFTSGSLLLTTITNGTTVSYTDTGSATGAGLPSASPTTGSLLLIKDINGTTVGNIGVYGNVTLGEGLSVTGIISGTACGAGATALCVKGNASSATPSQIIQGGSSQTGDLIQYQDKNAVTLSKTDVNGQLISYGTGQQILGLATPAFTTASTGTSYYYVMTATNAAGETLASASLGMANNTSTLAWTQVNGATGYKIYRNTSNSFAAGALLLTTITNGTTVGYTDTGSATSAGLPPTSVVGTKLVVQSWGNQTGDLVQFQSNTGSVLSHITGSGAFKFGSSTLSGAFAADLNSAGIDTVGLNIKASSAQTNSLIQLQNSSGFVQSSFNATGNQLTLGNSSASGTSAGILVISDGTASTKNVTIQVGDGLTALSNNITLKIPTNDTNATDTICLQTLANCGTAGAILNDGTGTANHVARFTSTTQIGNGLIYDNGTSVGINNAAPGATNLFSVGTLTTAQANVAAVISTGGAGNTGLVVQGAAGQTADLLQLQSSSAGGILRVGVNGDVGSGNQTGASTNSRSITLLTGDTSGSSSSTGTLTLKTGASTTSGNTGDIIIASGAATSGDSGNISIDAGTASGTKGSITIGATSAVNIGNGNAISISQSGGTLSFNTLTSLGSGNNISLSKIYTAGTGGVTQYAPVVLANDSGNSRVLDTATAHDPRVVGVAVDTVASGTVRVAISGTFTLNVDTAAVAIGDQLVTSTTSGKATVDNNATTGIVGIAMTSKAGGSAGTVTVSLGVVRGQANPTFSGNVIVNGTLQGNTFDATSGNALAIGGTNATGITIGKGGVTTEIQGNTKVTLSGTTATTLVCQTAGGLLGGCDSTLLNPTAGNFIQNQTASPQTAGFNISGNGTIGGNLAVTGTYNSNTFNSSNLTFGAASAATVQSASGQDIIVNATGTGNAKIQTNSVTAVLINNNGTVALGNTNTTSRLAISARTAATPTTGSSLRVLGGSVADSQTAASGTATLNSANGFEQNTITSANTNVTTTNAPTLYIQGATKAGTNMAITNSYGLQIDTASVAGGNGVQNAYGLSVQAPTGATNNYAAIFQGGNVGIGTTSPVAQLEVKGNAGTTSGAVTMTASSGSSSFTTSSSMTLYAGDWLIPTTTTGQAHGISTTATGTSFTSVGNFTANVNAETFTIYHPTQSVTDASGTPQFMVQGSTGNVSIGSIFSTTSAGVKLYVNGGAFITGNIFTNGSLANGTSIANAQITPGTTGTTISRNVADANAALTVTQTNASSTGDIVQFKNSSGTVANITQAGAANFAGVTSTSGITVTSGGSLATQKGTDFATTGTSNNVSFGSGSLYRLTGASAQTITGIAGGVDGRILTLVNAGSTTATLVDQSSGAAAGSSAANRITTGTGGDVALPAGSSITLIYDSSASLWRVTGSTAATGGSGVNTIGAISGTSNANGATITGTTLNLTAADGTNGGVLTAGTQTLGGLKTFQDGITSASINTTAGQATSLGNSTGAVAITGNSSSTFVINGTTVDATEFGRLDGKDAALVDTNDAVATAIIGTGALNSGSITSGFGSIDTGADNISTTGTVNAGIVAATTSISISSSNSNPLAINNITTSNTIATNAQLLIGTGGTTKNGIVIQEVASQGGTTYPFQIQNSSGNVLGGFNANGDVITGGTVRTYDQGSGVNSFDLTLRSGTSAGSGQHSGDVIIDNGAATSSATAGTISIGNTNTTGLTIGRSGIQTEIQGNTKVTLSGTTATTLVCQTAGGLLGGCDSTLLTPTASNFIRNQTTQQTNANINIQAASSSVGLTVQGASGQDIADFNFSGGGTAAKIDSSGRLTTAGVSSTISSSGANVSSVIANATNSNTTATASQVSGYYVSLTGTNNSNVGANTVNGITFAGVTAATNNTFNGLYFANTTYSNILNVGGTSIINGSGKLQDAGFDTSVNYSNLRNVTNLTATGSLTAGSINTTAAQATSLGNSTGALTITGNSSSTFVINGATVDATEFNRLDGKDAALVDTNDAVATAITGTGALTTGSINWSGNITTSGNISTTGTGTITSAGIITANAGITIANTGSLSTTAGASFTAPGTSTNAALNTASFYTMDTSGAAQVIQGITAGRDGQRLTLTNINATAVTIANNNGSATGAKIITGTGADISIVNGASVELIYDNAASVWRVVGGVGGTSVTTVGAISGTANANGATITGNTLNLTAADGTNGGVLTAAAQTLGGLKTFQDGITSGSINTTAGQGTSLGNTTGALTITGNSSSTFVINGTTVDATEFNRLDGKDAALVDTNDAVATAITGTGALTTGSINWSGNIQTSGNITTTGSGTITAAGLITANGGLTAANINTTAGQGTTLGNSTGTLTITGDSSSTFVINGSTIDATEFNRLDGKDSALVDTNDAVATAITGTGALTTGSINWSGNIQTSGNITTTGSGTITAAGLLTANGGLTAANINTTAAQSTSLGNSTGALTITGNSSSTFVINGITVDATEFNRLDGKDAALVDTNDAVATAITGTGALTTGSINWSGNIATSGNISTSGSGTITSAGIITANGGITVANTGSLSTAAGTTYTTAGTAANDLAISTASYYILDTTGAAQVINSIAAGRDGQQLTLTNADATNAVTLVNGGTGTNKIVTGTGANLDIAPGGSVSLIFDSTNTRWRVVGTTGAVGGAGVNTIGTYSSSNHYANGATISGTTLTLGSADASNPGLVDTSAQTFAGAKTFSALITGNAGITTTGGVVSLQGNAASSITTTSGNLTLDSAAILQLANTNATSVAIGHSGITTTITGGLTQQTGAVSLTANAASSFTTTTGNLTFDAAAALNLAQTNATSVAIGHSGIITTITGGLTQSTGAISLTGNATSQISTTTGNFTLDAAATVNIGTTNATNVTVGRTGQTITLNGDTTSNGNITVAANKSITITGGNTASRPASPTEGMVYYDTTTKQLLTYANGKWQADRSNSTKLVAASSSSQAEKDAADYVATGTNDETVINSALTAATGGKVYLFEGTYVLGASISIPNNTALVGSGRNTLITIPNGINANFVAVTNTDTTTGVGVTLRDLRLDGNKANQSGSVGMAGAAFIGVGGTGRSGVTITNVRSNNWYYGGTATNPCYYGAGICLSNTSYSTITDSMATSDQYGVLLLTTTSNFNVISNNLFQSNTAGITLSSATDNNVTGNNVQSSSAYGIFLSGASRNTIVGNVVGASGLLGINLSFSSNNVVSSNRLVNNGGSSNNDSIYLTSADSNTITGNSVSDTSATTTNYAINVFDNTSDTNYLADNNLGGGSINDAGTGTIYGGQLDGSNVYTIQGASSIKLGNNTTVTGSLTQSGGAISLQGNAASSITTTTGNLMLDAAAALQLGNTNATSINIGHGTIATAITGNASITNTNATTALAVSSNTTPTTAVLVVNDTSGTTTDKLAALQASGTTKFSVDATGNVVATGTYNTNTFTSSTLSFGAGTASTLGINQAAASTAGGNLTIQAGQSGAGAAATNGGDLILQGGAVGASSTGVQGLVKLSTTVFTSGAGNQSFGAGGGAVSQASVDQNSTIEISETVAGPLTVTIPAPTTKVTGRLLYVTISGSNSIIVSPNGGTVFTMNPGTGATLVWNTTINAGAGGWVNAGADGGSNSYIQNQTGSNQSASFQIAGTGQINTSLSTPLIDALSGGIIEIAKSVASTVKIGNLTAGNTATTNIQGGSGGITVGTAATSGSTNTGSVAISTGSVATGNNDFSGDITLATGGAVAGNNRGSGNVSITTGISQGTSASGSITIDTGIPGGSGTIGAINIGTSAAARAITIGSTTSGATTKLQGGAYSLNVTNTGVGINAGATPGNSLSINTLTTAQSGYQEAISTGGTTNGGLVIQGVASQNSTSKYFGVQDSSAANIFQIGADDIIDIGSSTHTPSILFSSTSLTSGGILKTMTAGTGGVSANDVVVFANDGGNARALDTTTPNDSRVFGVATTTASAGSTTRVATYGFATVKYTGTAPAVGDILVTSATGGSVQVDNFATKGILGYATTAGSGGTVGVAINPVGGAGGSNGNTLVQVPASNTAGASGANVISPVTSGVTGLTVNGTTSGTAATAAIINQSQNAVGLQINGSGTDTTSSLLSLATTTATSGSLLNISQTTSSFTGTGATINITNPGAGAKLIDLQNNASSKFNVDANGVVTLAGGQTADITTSGATTLKVDTGGSAAITLGGTNASAINIGHGTIATAITGNASITNTNATTTLAISSNTTPTTAVLVVNGTSGTGTDKLLALQASGTSKFTVDANGNVVVTNSTTSATTADEVDSTGASGTQTNGYFLNHTGAGTLTNGVNVTNNNASGTLTNGVAITNTSGTLSHGLSFSGTIGAVGAGSDIYRAAGTVSIQGASGASVQSTTDNAAAFAVQNSLGATVINADTTLGTNLAVNSGAETTFSGTDWTALSSGTIARDTTNFASGVAGVSVGMAQTNGRGVINNLASNPAISSTYMVTFSARLASGAPSFSSTGLLVKYSRDGGTNMVNCYGNTSANAVYPSPATITSTGWTKVVCYFTTDNTTATNPDLQIFQNDSPGSNRTMYIDNLSVIAANTSGTQNASVIKIGGNASQGLVLFQLDTYATTPFTGANAALAGAMYFDTTAGKMQCYDGTIWGACGAAPNSLITLTPEYTGATLHGTTSAYGGSDTNLGNLQSDFCANQSSVLVVGSLCSNGDARNFYQWSSVQTNYQSYGIYVTYKLPSTFKAFVGNVTLTGRVDNITNAGVNFNVFKSSGGTITRCGAAGVGTNNVTNVVGWDSVSANNTVNTWQTASITPTTSCTWAAGDYVIVRIDTVSKSSANAYVENLNFTYSNQ